MGRDLQSGMPHSWEEAWKFGGSKVEGRRSYSTTGAYREEKENGRIEEEEPTGVDAMCERTCEEIVCAEAVKDQRRGSKGLIGGQGI